MKLLILTQYFPPETGAPQNRLYELALRLKDMGIYIEVLTAMPNYPKSEIFKGYEGKKYLREEIGGITVHRTKIFVTKSKGIFKRLLNYFSFVRSSYNFGKKLKNFDFILCESPPLFLGYSAMKLSKKMKAKLIFNVSDLWPESAEKMGLVTNRFFLKMAYNLEKKCYQRALLITGQTQGIVKNIKDRFPTSDVYWLPNGVDLAFYNPDKKFDSGFRNKLGFSESDLVLFYGGIIGHAQGLETILHAASALKNNDAIKFVLMGNGPVKADLQDLSGHLNLKNLHFLDSVSKNEMGAIINEIDISIVPLRKLDLFKGAIPSKIFEILAMEKPILLGVEGEAKELFIDAGKAGWAFEPENSDELARKIQEISENRSLIEIFGKNGRRYVAEKFNRDTIAKAFYQKLIDINEKK